MASITPMQVMSFAPLCRDFVRYSSALDKCLAAGEINTPLRVAHFMAQAHTETGGLRRLVENLSYTSADRLDAMFSAVHDHADAARLIAAGPEATANRVYASRYGNGDEASGDGWRYRGRGGLQLTFRDNYRTVGHAIGMDLEGHPELLEQPETAFLASAKYWAWKSINAFADRDDVVGVTRLINPALAGLDDRKVNLTRAKAIWS
jgi:putative chitinase